MTPHTIIVASGGVGTSGEQLVNTVLAQFPGRDVRLVIIPQIRDERQLDEAIETASQEAATLVHTMADAELRRKLIERCAQRGITAVDLMGPLLESLETTLGCRALGQPGLYRLLKREYFERVAAIEYTMSHDDGLNPQTWSQADLLLIGVSRVGKTPLSLYLSVQGWKAANYPLVPGLKIPAALEQHDPGRVIGLTIQPGQLIALRQDRQRRIGPIGLGRYTDPQTIYEEIEFGIEFFRRHGFTTVDVTDKPIESSADEVTRIITSRYPQVSRLG